MRGVGSWSVGRGRGSVQVFHLNPLYFHRRIPRDISPLYLIIKLRLIGQDGRPGVCHGVFHDVLEVVGEGLTEVGRGGLDGLQHAVHVFGHCQLLEAEAPFGPTCCATLGESGYVPLGSGQELLPGCSRPQPEGGFPPSD